MHVFESEFASGIKDVSFVLIYIFNYMLRMAVLDRIRGWFYYVFKVKTNAVKAINQ